MLDEMIELFSVLNQLEKGALGLFFEMNYLVGVILAIYITWFVVAIPAPTIPTELDENGKMLKFLKEAGISKENIANDYAQMHGWLYFHFVYLFISMILSLVVFFIYTTINSKLSVKESNSKEKAGKETAKVGQS